MSATKNKEEAHLYAQLDTELKKDGNKTCADCKAKGPKWASVNLGIFLCWDCGGKHRNLGTDISRIRSTNLDKWTQEQVDVCDAWFSISVQHLTSFRTEGMMKVPRVDMSMLHSAVHEESRQCQS
jgi:hypothetical protein